MRLEEIRKEYDAENDTLEELKKKLRSKLSEIHPDNNNGDCDKNYFSKINDDLEYIEKRMSKEKAKKEIKLSSNDLLELVQELNQVDILRKNSIKNELQKKFDESIKEQTIKYTNQFKIKRYSLAGVTALITFLWMLPDKILEHPIMKHFFAEDFIYVLSFIWGILLLFTILYWFFTFKIEKTEKEILEKVTIEDVQNELFTNYIKSYIKDEKSFLKRDFMNYLLCKITCEIKNKKLRKLVCDSISMKLIQNIADIILKRAEERKIVQKVENHSLIEQFELIKE